MLAYLRDGSAQAIMYAATLRLKLRIKLSISFKSQYTDTRPTTPRADPKAAGVWQGSHLRAKSVA